jgi:hypothetical protein
MMHDVIKGLDVMHKCTQRNISTESRYKVPVSQPRFYGHDGLKSSVLSASPTAQHRGRLCPVHHLHNSITVIGAQCITYSTA